MTADIRERIGRYVGTHPDASVAEVLGRFGLDLDERALVADILDAEAPGEPNDAHEREEARAGSDDGVEPSSWREADWSDPGEGTYPPAWRERDQWMCHTHGDKKPFAPWGDRDHPAADEDADARWKWGLQENYTDLETAREWAEKHPRLAGVTYLLNERGREPFAFVDGDDVRCPETGEVHPGFVALLDRLGTTYADVSTSGSGVHAVYSGDLPERVKQAKVPLDDEPWGANDDAPVAEVYDHKKVCVSTGAHVPGTPVAVGAWDDDALTAWLDEHDAAPDPTPDPAPGEAAAFDVEACEAETTSREETATDIRNLFAAIDCLDAQRVAARTTVDQWNDGASTGEGERAFVRWPPLDLCSFRRPPSPHLCLTPGGCHSSPWASNRLRQPPDPLHHARLSS